MARAETPSVGEIFIDELEKRIIRDYYERHLHDWQQTPEGHEYYQSKGKKKNKHKGLPPGLAKRETLPPGLEKQLARNGQLPPGLQYRALPSDLTRQLRPLPAGYMYRIVDNRVLLIQAASNVILDLLEVAAVEIFD